MWARAEAFRAEVSRRRTVRDFSSEPVPRRVIESCLAAGVLVTALHLAGLATLTHTPSPMAFLGSILGRPANERPFVLLVAGYPAPGATVPDIARKPLDEIAVFLDGAADRP
jgi:hypothetical protein